MSKQALSDTRVRCVYVGGPCDNQVELRATRPEVGEPVHRLDRGNYVKYVWNGGVFEFEG
jgi:hypothetical protein